MRTIRRIPAIILLSLSLAEVSSGLSVSSSSLGMSNPLLQVEHPLIYRPMSLASPGAPPYVPSDIRIAYDFTPLYAHSINGSSTRIAIIDAYGDSKLSSDLSSFDSLTGLTPGRLNTYYPAGYVSETAWSGSGAGSSTIFAKPTWQQNLPGTMRELTDVSYNADPNTGVLVVQNGLQYEVGGTSASSPQIAALIALASEVSGVRYGSIGSKLYIMTYYNDITDG